jgi:hypothetical protein
MEVIQMGVVLSRPPKDKPGRVQVGDVAKLTSGRLVARCRFDVGDGTSAYTCRDYDLGEVPETAPVCAAPTNWDRWIDEEMNRHPGQYRQLGPRDCERERAEFAKFRAEWPAVASRIAAWIDFEVSPAPADLFCLGTVLYPFQSPGVNWRGFVDRHAGGEFGAYGKYDPAPLPEEALWTISEQPIGVANRAAIAAKTGPVRSRFVLGDKRLPQGVLPQRPQLAVVDVLTVLSPRGPRTLMKAHSVDAGP